VLEQANIDQPRPITVTLGGCNSSPLGFVPMITHIRMELSGSELTLTPSVDDDDTTSMTYAWTMTSGSFSISSPQQSKASISAFDESEITVSLVITDRCGSSNTASCTWQTNPTTCTFVE